MRSISKKIIKNYYIRTVNDAVFLNLFKSLVNKSNLKLRDKTYYHILIQYPDFWPHDLDLFSLIDSDALTEIQNKNCYFVFDASAEGFSPFEKNWFDIFYNNCEKYNVDPQQIILVSSNLLDEENIKMFCKTNNKKPINVFSLPFFESACRTSDNIDSLITESIDQTKKNFIGKYFSSLSRLNRYQRSVGTFLLCQSSVKDKGLISHDSIKHCTNYNFSDLIKKTNYTEKQIKKWSKSLPLIVDYNDFDINWACNREFKHIHNQTIFQVVNETLVDNFNNTSLFYSEKTFRPISCFQPFLIYGQKGCNHYLKNLGYKTYEDWFDLSFDNEDDYIRRYQKLLLVIKDNCKYLDSLTRDQQIEWKFKNLDVLIHNVKTMNSQNYTLKKLNKFLLELESQIEAQSK